MALCCAEGGSQPPAADKNKAANDGIDGDAGAKDELALTSPGRGDCAGVRKAAAQCSASAPASDGRGVVGVDEDGCKVGARGV